mmetsp:Transcript_6895/g.18542  ORF Transcript_6895/g.18542 Transcript_6895/m.18542 type:complete len:261 (+) Transcript_6895:269-1051(+)
MQQRGGLILGSAASMALLSSSCAGAMSGVWKAPPALMTRACSALAAVASTQSLSTAVLSPAQVKPAGNRTFAIWHTALGLASASFASLQSLSSVGRSRPATEHICCGTDSVAACIAIARILTSSRQSSKSSTSAAQMAVYSPRLRPAVAWTRRTSSFRVCLITSTPARPATNMAGWQYRVSLSLDSGPLRHRSLRSQPSTFSALASISATAGRCMQSFIMPTYCEPWPAKRMATGRAGFPLAGGQGTCDLGRSLFSRVSS